MLVRLLDLTSRNCFETISAFFHVVTTDEEAQLSGDPLKKIRPLHNEIKMKCLEFYQLLRELSIDERIVKSKARTHFRQYIRNTPTKWGFKYWVLADPTGYTVDFNLYCGKERTVPLSGQGLSYDVMELVQPFQLQVAITNAFVLHKWQLMMQGSRTPSESLFRDKVVLSIIRSYSPTPDPLSYPATCRVQHGSTAFSGSSRRCCYCQQRTRRYCPDCPFQPVLCQYADRDCHGEWHSPPSV